MTSVVDLSRPPRSLCLHACALTSVSLYLYILYFFIENYWSCIYIYCGPDEDSQTSIPNDVSYSSSPLLSSAQFCVYVWCVCVWASYWRDACVCVVSKQSETERLIVGWKCVRVCVWICHHDSLLLQPHPVCETLGWALSCPTLGNYTHFISTCKTAGGIQPENRRPSREAKTDYFHFHLSSAIFFLFFFHKERGQTCTWTRTLCKHLSLSVSVFVLAETTIVR